jgi:acylphosphatase
MEAKRLGLKGWVKNCSDGSVELIAEGDLAMLEELKQWCRQGPPGAVVRRVELRWEDLTDEFDDFLIKR